jgi:hypothetical protein
VQPEEFSKFVELTGEKPTWDVSLAQRTYARWWKMGHIHKSLFAYLKNVVGVNPEPSDVQGYYAAALNGGKGYGDTPVADALQEGIRLTGIQPSSQAVERFYQTRLSHNTLQDARKVEEITRVPISEEHIKAAYNRLLKKGDFYELRTLQRETGVAASFEPTAIQEAYTAFFQHDDIQSATQLYLETDVEPQEQEPQLIENCCSRRLKGGKEYRSAWQDVKWLASTLPNATIPIIQEHIRELVADNQFVAAEHLLRALEGEAQPAIPEQFAIACQKAYWTQARKLLDNHGGEIIERYPLFARVVQDQSHGQSIAGSR